MKIGRSGAFLLFLLFGCSQQKAESRVKELLIDPSSAEFSDVYTKNDVTCGFVNSKNRLGGFTGPRVFIVHGETADISGDIPEPALVNQLSDCDARVIDRLARVTLNDKFIAAEKETRAENAKNP